MFQIKNSIYLVIAILLHIIFVNSNATIYTVTNTLDSGVGSLRQAIVDSNANAGDDEVHFNISEGDCDSAGVCHIDILSDMPHISDALLIDGTTQSQYGTAPTNVCATESDPSYMRIQLSISTNFDIIELTSASPSTIKGLSIGGNMVSGLTSAIRVESNTRHVIQCNHIGVNAQGNVKTSLFIGISIDSDNGLVGTNSDGIDDISERNIIVGIARGVSINRNDNITVAGNYFNLSSDGLSSLTGSICVYARQSSTNNTIGSNMDGIYDSNERNIFGGCTTAINIGSISNNTINTISNNWIGRNVNGVSIGVSTGILIQGNNNKLIIVSNLIDSADTAILIQDSAKLQLGSTNNCIINSTVGINHTGTSQDQPFTNNYWGDASGPSGIGSGSGALINYSSTGTINYDPWNTSFQQGCQIDIAPPSLKLTKATGIIDDIDKSNSITVGDIINYNFTIENTGNAELVNIIIDDPSATTIMGSPVFSIGIGNSDTSVTSTHVITQLEYDSGNFVSQSTASATAGGIVAIASDTSDDPTDETDSTTGCPAEQNACDPTVVNFNFPVYSSNPASGSFISFGFVAEASTDQMLSININNIGHPNSIINGTCSINGSDADRFYMTSDATFSIVGGGETDTEIVACDSQMAGSFQASLDCSYDDNEIIINSYTLACSVNSMPTTTEDIFTSNEDEVLNVSKFSVLDNDVDQDEKDLLSILNPGTYTATGIGGSIDIAVNGTFIYTPPPNFSGQAGLSFDVTDGLNSVPSSLTINVLPVNDAPVFSVLGDVDVTNLVSSSNTQIQVPDFVENIVFGPDDENTQMVQQFNLLVMDSESIISNIDINNNGTLSVDFSLNYGVALIEATLQDNGGIENGGIDTSISVDFIVAHLDLVFADGFEATGGFRLFDYLDSLTSPINNTPTYDVIDDSLSFYGHQLNLNNNYENTKVLMLVKFWMQEIVVLEDPTGDFDQDGILNVHDNDPINRIK